VLRFFNKFRRRGVNAFSVSSATKPAPGSYRQSERFTTRRETHGPRIGWEQVLNLDWAEAQHALTLTALTPQGQNRTTLRIAEPGPLVDLAQERVRSTYLLSARASLADHGEAIVTARRQPGSGQTMWQITLDDHVDHTDPTVQAGIDTVIEELRGHIQA